MLSVFIFSFLFVSSACVIYNLNETEYARMPPLSKLDDHEACLAEERGLYCLLKLNLFDDGENPLMELIREYSNYDVKHYNHTILERGVCVQKTCHEYVGDTSETGEALTHALGACLNESIWREYGLQANVSLLYYCDRHAESEAITSLDWTVASAFIIIGVVNLIASLYDYAVTLYGKGHGNKYVLSFSMFRNYKWLVSKPDLNIKTQGLQCIYFARTLLNMLMIMAHSILIFANGFTRNIYDFEKAYDLVYYQLVFNGLMIVQMFFFISGFLLAFNFQLYAEKIRITWFDIPKVMFLRCCRLTPSLAVVMAFSVTWLRHLSSGPLWKLFVTYSVVADCRKFWWHHLLFINNYMKEDKYCGIQTWHIAADSQLYIIGLLVCVLTMSRGRYLALSFLLVVGTILPALQVWLQDLDGLVIMYPEFYRTLDNVTFRSAHLVGHCNMQCFFAGMLVAYLVYDWQNKGVDFSKNKYFSIWFWLTPVLTALCFYAGHWFYAEGGRASLIVRMLYAAVHRLGLAAICTVFIIGMFLKAPSYIRTLSEWPGWVVTSRLSYSVFLLHMNLVHIAMGTRMQLVWFSHFNIAFAYLGVVIVAYILAVPLFLMVEAPFNSLVKVLLDRLKPLELHTEKKIS